ncbi:MAG: addiction module protein [Acidobacteria bacterium]|nr:addiction module protein [Acidobacteriota bacterium]
MARQTRNWNIGLARDLRDQEFAREFLIAALEGGVPLKTVLLKLPAGQRADLAMALWASLSDQKRYATQELSDEQKAELDRRWAEHPENPKSGIPWSDVRRKLREP